MNEDFGEQLYTVKADNDVSGVMFILIGLIIAIVANFIFAKAILFAISVIFLLIGRYIIRRFKYHFLFFYTSVIFLKKPFSTVVMPVSEIIAIEFKVLPTITKTTIIYYPIVLLANGERIKLYKIYQGEFKQVIDDYKALHGF